MKSLFATAIATTIVVLCLNLSAQDEKKKKPAIDWKETDATEFTKKLEKATAAGEKWTKNPESIILEYVGPFVSKDGEKAAANRSIRIFTKGEGVPKVLNVQLIDDGLFDDSIKTQRTRLALSRSDDGKWKLRKAFKSQEKWPKIEN